MKFYGNGIVWDKTANKALCKFVDGVFETDNADICAKLAVRYKSDEVVKPENLKTEKPIKPEQFEKPTEKPIVKQPRKPRTPTVKKGVSK